MQRDINTIFFVFFSKCFNLFNNIIVSYLYTTVGSYFLYYNIKQYFYDIIMIYIKKTFNNFVINTNNIKKQYEYNHFFYYQNRIGYILFTYRIINL